MNTEELYASMRSAWSAFAAPPISDLAGFDWRFGDDSARAFVGIAPMDVDIASAGFLGCTPLLDIAPAASAAYLGTYLLALLRGLSLQEKTGMFHDILTRAHVLHCLQEERFWHQVVRAHLPAACRAVIGDLAHHLPSRRELLALTEGEVQGIIRHSSQ